MSFAALAASGVLTFVRSRVLNVVSMAFCAAMPDGCATRVNSGTEKGVRESVPPPLRLFLCPKGEDSHHQFCLQPFPNVVVYAEIDVPALVVQLPHISKTPTSQGIFW